MYGHQLSRHARRSTNPLCFTDDARVWIWPLFRYSDPTSFPDDYIGTYFRRVYMPAGYKALYKAAAFWVDPESVSKVLPYVLLVLTLIPMGLASWKLGGAWAAWATLALMLSTDIFLARLAGGLPRGFAFPLFAWLVATLLLGRIYWASLVVCLAAALYPPMAIPSGIAVAAALFFLPSRDRAEASGWSVRKRMALLAATATVSGLLMLPQTLASHDYGKVLMTTESSRFPEVGVGGRRGNWMFAGFLQSSLRAGGRAFVGQGPAWSSPLRSWATGGRQWSGLPVRGVALLLFLAGVSSVGFIWLCFSSSAARRFLAVAASVPLATGLTALFMPLLLLPNRYARYCIPTLLLIVVPAGAAALPKMLGRFERWRWSVPLSVFTLSALILLFLGARASDKSGLICTEGHQATYRFVGSLPPETLIAGWPSDPPIKNFPYLTHRRAFITRETHATTHEDFVEEMRTRMRALIEAYFASSMDPLVRLRDHFGVTHLVVNKDYFFEKTPLYFKPFDEWVNEARAKGMREGFEVPRHIEEAGVFSDDHYVVLDLGRLHPLRRAP